MPTVGRFEHIIIGNKHSSVTLGASPNGQALVFGADVARLTIGASYLHLNTQLVLGTNQVPSYQLQLDEGQKLGWIRPGVSTQYNITCNVADHALVFESSNGVERMRISSTGFLSLGTTDSTLGQLAVDQASTTGAIPVVSLEQRDIDQDWFEFDTTIGTGNATEAIGAKTLTTTHFLKVTLTGVGARYFPVGTIA